MILFIDTETTGLFDATAPIDAEHQPHLLQLGAILCNDSGEKRGRFELLIRPGGITIPEAATRVHGLTVEACQEGGVSLHTAMLLLQCYCAAAHTIVSYNWDYDRKVIEAECKRLRIGTPWGSDIRQECAMKLAAQFCGDRSHAGQSKYPNLSAAHQDFFNEPLEGAHGALADATAAARVWFHCQLLVEECKRHDC